MYREYQAQIEYWKGNLCQPFTISEGSPEVLKAVITQLCKNKSFKLRSLLFVAKKSIVKFINVKRSTLKWRKTKNKNGNYTYRYNHILSVQD